MAMEYPPIWRGILLLNAIENGDFPSSHVCLPYVSLCSTRLFTSMNIQAPHSSISPQNNYGFAFSKCTMFSVYAIQGVLMIPSCQQGSQVKMIPKVCSTTRPNAESFFPNFIVRFWLKTIIIQMVGGIIWSVLFYLFLGWTFWRSIATRPKRKQASSPRSVSPWPWDDRRVLSKRVGPWCSP